MKMKEQAPTVFGLDAERWEAFLAALEAPPREIPQLEKLMREPSVPQAVDDGNG
jgi:uncharacterized protein (DUF1778 family)